MEIEIFKYDKKRVGIAYENGIEDAVAKRLMKLAEVSGWTDMDLKKWNDDSMWSVVVCRPKTARNMIKAMRRQGGNPPLGFEQEMYDRCVQVMVSEEPSFLSRREYNRKKLSKDQIKQLDEMKKEVETRIDKIDPDEVSEETWEEVDEGKGTKK